MNRVPDAGYKTRWQFPCLPVIRTPDERLPKTKFWPVISRTWFGWGPENIVNDTAHLDAARQGSAMIFFND
jgi:hypothetical protein